ncbi:MAG: redoxin domain-containing protein [Planctomycetes bacterium]|nr:redoxin domain-containing protein [Planctomycetota bacterium]
MSKTGSLAAVIALGFVAVLVSPPSRDANAAFEQRPLPEFTQTSPEDWINSPPLRVRDLIGKVLLLDIWTFECWNCYRSFPWLREIEARFKPKGLQVIGIHSPEFERERDPAAVRAKVVEFGLEHPVMIDSDFAYWNALGNRAWPTFYLIDKRGRLRDRFLGETHAGEPQALRIERAVEALLAE